MKGNVSALRAYGALVVSRNVLVLLVLLAIVQASALAVAYTTYRSRVLFSQLEAMRDEAVEMQVVWHQLLLEHSTLASYNRVVEVAQMRLGMKIPDPHAVVVLHNPNPVEAGTH